MRVGRVAETETPRGRVGLGGGGQQQSSRHTGDLRLGICLVAFAAPEQQCMHHGPLALSLGSGLASGTLLASALGTTALVLDIGRCRPNNHKQPHALRPQEAALGGDGRGAQKLNTLTASEGGT